MRQIKKSAASQTVYLEVLDSSSTTGGRKTGLVFNTSSLTGYYVRNGGSATAITLATLAAANSAWSSGGFKEVDATNMPGVYRLDVPDAAILTGAESVVFTLRGAATMAQVSLEVQLVDNTPKDVYDRVGAPVGASISADIAQIYGVVDTEVAAIKTQTDKFVFTVANQVDCNVLGWKSATAPAMTGDAFARLGVPAGASASADIAAIKAVLPVALVGGRMDSSIGAVANGAIAAAAFAANALDAVWSTATRLLSAGTNIVLAKGTGLTGLNDLSGAAIASALGVSTALDTQLNGILLNTPSANTNADALLDRADGVETSFSVRAILRLHAAALFGRISGGGTATETVRDINNTKNRLVYSVDVDGNRTNVAADVS